jgi:hypothetical protein
MTSMKSRRLASAAAMLIRRLAAVAVVAFGLAGAAFAQTPGGAAAPFIDRLSAIDDGNRLIEAKSKDEVVSLKMRDRVAVILAGNIPAKIDASKALLFLNGHKITDLKDVAWLPGTHALVFRLSRNSDNAGTWNPVLGAPGFAPRPVAVGLWLDVSTSGPLIVGADGTQPSFQLVLIPGIWLFAAIVAVLLVIAAVWAAASRTNVLKDSLLPQLAPREQPFSLGRSQMAFWFMVVFATYAFLFVLLWDYNTLTTQSLVLMGLSSATAVFAVAIDAAKETPIGAANETLRAIGLATYGDVLRLDAEIAQRQHQLAATPPVTPDQALRLQTEITDRLNQRRAWHEITRPFVSGGWFRDLTSDINGPALHRLQMVVWTLTLGFIFVIEVYLNLSMPEFSATLLGLMGITSAGYLGFKYPEQQN